MPISSISTILIHNHAPVLENAAILKNAGKQHFAGVSANNENQSYFIGVFFRLLRQSRNFLVVSIGQYSDTRVRITCYVFFGKPYLLLPVNPIYYHLLNYPYYTNYYNTLYHIMYHTRSTTIISILQYCYHIVTIIISTIYSYIYRYNLSIKRYNNQYRYKRTDSMIRIIPKNTEINIYTVYTQHNYAIINTLLLYSNFLLAYHSYLPLKQ